MTNKDLFEILIREHQQGLTAFLRSLARDSQTVDDLFQETMLAAWKRLDNYDKTRPFGPWLRGIAAKIALAERRKAAKRFMPFDEETLERLEECWLQVQRQPGDIFEEKLDALRHCLSALPDHYRQALEARYQDGLAGEELAARLQIGLENLKKRLQRGLKMVLDCVKPRIALN